MAEIDLIVRVVEGLGTLALVTMLYSAIVRSMSSRARRFAVGLVFGAAASLVMVHPFTIMPGLVVDARCVLLVLAGPFGGASASFIAGFIAAVTRYQIGGVGTCPGVAAIILASGAGMAYTRFPKEWTSGDGLRPLLLLAAVGSCQSASFLLLPPEIMLAVIRRAMVPVVLINSFGVVLLGLFLRSERNRIDAAAQSEREATTDPLTDLSNRRHFERTASARIARGKDAKVALLLIDIDHFKAVNDRYGHDVGDAVLRDMAHVMRRTLRSTDIIARLGGEEFAVLIDSAAADVGPVAEKLRTAIERRTVKDGIPSITVSIGVAAAASGDDTGTVLKRADVALYEAKRRGRNQVHFDATRMMAA